MITNGRLRLAITLRLLAPLALGTLLIALAATLTGCHAAPTGQRSPRPDPSPVIAAHTAKDAAITDSASRIDTLRAQLKPTQPFGDEAPARASQDWQRSLTAETDRIRQAVKDAPAQQVATLATQYAHNIDALQTKLQKEELRDTRLYRQSLRATGLALLLGFTLSLILGKATAATRTWPLALLGATTLALAEGVGTQWFQIGCAVLLAALLAYATHYLIGLHRSRRALREIVPTLDEAYELTNDEGRALLDRAIFERLSDRFGPTDKATIHDIRKEAAHA